MTSCTWESRRVTLSSLKGYPFCEFSAGRMRVQLKSPSATICVRWVLVGSPRAQAYPKSRSIAASQLRNNNPSHPTTAEEKRAITSLKNDPNITIVPTDKGGATVITDKEDYKAKALQQLSNAETYATVTTDPTPKQTRAIQNSLDKLVREETLPAPTARKLSPKETSIACAYGLTKILLLS